jgi:SAM-dependent methyltransferase
VSYDPEAFDAFEAAGWAEKDAGAYDMLLGRVTDRLAEPLLDAVEAGPGTRLLDLATGPGYVAGRAVERGAEAVGLDRSEAMLEFAREHVPGAEFVRGDVTAIPFEDQSFDAVTAAFLLLHLGEPERAGAEAARVLEPGGAAAFTVWDVPSRGRWLGVLVDAIEDVGVSAPADVPAGPPFFRFADEKELTTLITGAGLADPAVDTVEFPLHVGSADELWDGLIEGAVRMRALVQAQNDDVQRSIRARFDELLDDAAADDGFEVSVSVKLGSGRKP